MLYKIYAQCPRGASAFLRASQAADAGGGLKAGGLHLCRGVAPGGFRHHSGMPAP